MRACRSVLELGSGVGLTGLSVCLQCAPKSFCFTDSHLEVLERLRENIHLNITSENSLAIELGRWGSCFQDD